MDFQALKTLVQSNPSWESMTSIQLADWCNAEAVSQSVDRLSVETIYETIVPAGFAALSADEKNEVWNILILHAAGGVPTQSGSRARDRLVAIFGAGSATIQALAAKLTRLVSRAAAAGIIQTVTPGDVEFALTL